MFNKKTTAPFRAVRSTRRLASQLFTTITVALTVVMFSAMPANATGVISATSPPPPNPNDPSQYFPGGPNFSLFSTFSPLTTLVFGVLDFILLMAGVWVLITSLIRSGTAGRDIGKRGHGLNGVLWGGIMILAAIIVFPLVFLIITVSQEVAKQV
jgi:hypothetical protein